MAKSLQGFLLFPEAFGVLVLSKLYLVGKAAIVPSMTERGDDLAGANAKLAVLAGLAGFVASPIGVGVLQLGAPWVLRLGFVVFAAGAAAALRLPRPDALESAASTPGNQADGSPPEGPLVPPLALAPGAGPGPGAGDGLRGGPGGVIYHLKGQQRRGARRGEVARERRQLGLPLIVPEVTLALGAMTVLRGVFGFLIFSLAFEMRAEHVATWWYGFILLASGVGGLLGSLSVPRVRRRLSEQQLILANLALTTVVGVLCGLSGALGLQPLVALVVGYASTAAKPAFDSIAQRHVPPAALGRAFARFETQLQLVWVLCALVAVLVSFPYR
ncbi:MAG: MFS transporter, partial [Acidimicrobiales bacterium]